VDRQVCQEGRKAVWFHVVTCRHPLDGGETSRCTLGVGFQPPPQGLQL
jgi:hypothetical protein